MRRAGVLLAVVLGLGFGLTGSARAAAPRLYSLHATRGAQPAIFDSRGREVILRGIAVNQLGDYYRERPAAVPVFDLGARDFDGIRSLGFNVVRLVLSWSRLEPTRGHIDTGYLKRIHDAVAQARRRGLYVILDMHQDAWGKGVASPAGELCAPGFERSIGWDGAPAWATRLDGMSTCHAKYREVAPAVAQAFHNFYLDRDGIQSELVKVWGKLAREFAAEPAVAGFDLLNEPHPGLTPGPAAGQRIGDFYARAISAVRAAERSHPRGFSHVVFFEPSVTYDITAQPDTVPPPTFTADRNIVFAPHLYPGTFSPVSVDDAFKSAARVAQTYQTTFWVGEWGWYSPNPRTDEPQIRDYARHEDDGRIGGAWWLWREACGDPHIFYTAGAPGEPLATGLARFACPGGRRLGIPRTTHRALSRPYVRAAPGRIDRVTADGSSGDLEVRGRDDSARGSCAVLIWVPASRRGAPRFERTHVGRLSTRRVAGGWLVTGCARGSYSLRRRPGHFHRP